MWHIHPTEQWIEQVVKLMNEHQLKPEHSRFMIAFFSSMDNDFVDYFRSNKDRISSFSGRNVHIFTPLIYENNVIPDEHWRYMRDEFRAWGIPVKTDPTFVFFFLDKWRHDHYEPSFFAGFVCSSFSGFPNNLKNAIDACIEVSDTRLLSSRLSEVFLTENIIPHDQVDFQFKQTITRKLPTSTLFISHSSADKPFARRLIAELSKDETLRCWIDEGKILAGDDFQQAITNALRRSDYLLIIISESSTQSSWVNFEISQFMSLADGKRIIPIVISKGHRFVEAIDNLIRRLNYLDFRDESKWQENIEKLKQSLVKTRTNEL